MRCLGVAHIRPALSWPRSRHHLTRQRYSYAVGTHELQCVLRRPRSVAHLAQGERQEGRRLVGILDEGEFKDARLARAGGGDLARLVRLHHLVHRPALARQQVGPGWRHGGRVVGPHGGVAPPRGPEVEWVGGHDVERQERQRCQQAQPQAPRHRGEQLANGGASAHPRTAHAGRAERTALRAPCGPRRIAT